MNVKFFLKNPQKDSLILLKTWSLEGPLPFVLSINERCDPKYWDFSKGQCKVSKEFSQSTWLNAILEKYRTKALDYMRKIQVEEERLPTHEELKKHLEDFKAKLTGKTTTCQKEKNIFDYFDKVAEELKKNVADADGNITKRGAWEHYLSTKRQFEEFTKTTRRPTNWASLDAEFFAAYQDWLFAQGDNSNTVTAKWKRLKRVLNTAKEDGLYTGESHKRRTLAMSFQKADEIFLTIEELMRIYHLDLSHTTLAETRDEFLLDAFAAGFRFGDLTSLTGSKVININDRKALKLHTGKTDTAVVTPGSWYLEEFLEKYKKGFPKKKANSVFNKNVRKICLLSGITEPTTLRKNIAGKNQDVTKPKYMWASQYTARYSFATNLFLSGVDIKQISTLLGHSKVSTTETYIKAKQLETALTMSEHAFFTEKPTAKTAT